MNLADLAWPELGDRRLLAVPLGATEQHGPHLPYTVDTEIAVELCRRLGEARPEVVVAPALPYGSSGEHADFPGTLSIGQEATELLLVELVRSADAFAGVLLVSAHGGNAVPLRRAVAKLRYEGRNVRAWCPDGPADDTHAGRLETSVMLALRPEAVRTNRFEPGETRPLPELIGRLRDEGVRGVSPNGVLGDPARASAEAGRATLSRWADALLEAAAALARDGIM
ncbi:putative mycofactocin system creatinine amidohydrolase family protein MftE [Amycolatopsis deserti]|uniref:Mycofactocin system creatinine amidohydrolase family protein MftE n=1 Tax=Amycolatopsis deserti TaxID=185696 RepID=A0ABQ3J719_9PSEU|nr:mycofactocin biosynthesis peptidyl-dipeptidase MftE [Amycolatopsis deserti]GHF05604.1 putative mycofactocin system creatinine amidohydrolase family protein MftE [Amycolatopsis deserti]